MTRRKIRGRLVDGGLVHYRNEVAGRYLAGGLCGAGWISSEWTTKGMNELPLCGLCVEEWEKGGDGPARGDLPQ